VKINRRLLILILLLTISLQACFGVGSIDNERQATVQAMQEQIQATATSDAIYAANPDSAVQTAEARATASAGDLLATQAAQQAFSDEIRAATATAFSPMIADLTTYGLDESSGRPGWIHPPVTVNAEGYRQYGYANQFLNTVAQDFAVSADITWNTDYGNSGCGFILRSDGNEEDGNHYAVVITRGSSGHALLATMAEGEVVNVRDLYAYGLDPEFDWKNDTTNRLTVVARGQKFSIYTNGTLLGELDPSEPPPGPLLPPAPSPPIGNNPIARAAYMRAKAEYDSVVQKIRGNYAARLKILQDSDTIYERGFIALVALNESGSTTCQFDNAWLWLIE
jgi:hypothetical protein